VGSISHKPPAIIVFANIASLPIIGRRAPARAMSRLNYPGIAASATARWWQQDYSAAKFLFLIIIMTNPISLILTRYVKYFRVVLILFRLPEKARLGKTSTSPVYFRDVARYRVLSNPNAEARILHTSVYQIRTSVPRILTFLQRVLRKSTYGKRYILNTRVARATYNIILRERDTQPWESRACACVCVCVCVCQCTYRH